MRGSSSWTFWGIEHIPAQIHTAQHRAVLSDGTGHAHAHALDAVPGEGALLHLFLDRGDDIGKNVVPMVLDAGGDGPFFHQVAGGLKQSDLNGGAAGVNAKGIRGPFRPRDGVRPIKCLV